MMAIVFGLFSGVFFEVYFKCDHLTYQIKLVKEDNNLRLELVERKESQSTNPLSKSRTRTQSSQLEG
jgi:hypothetical protein